MADQAKRQRDKRHDAHRYAQKPWRKWYSRKAWLDRAAAQLAKQPLCERHLAQGQVVAATVANHRQRHGGDWNLFITGELESACKPCHDGPIQSFEMGGYEIGCVEDGMPVDKSHPWLTE